MHKVIKFFNDLQDNDYAYNVGDTFPRSGVTVSKARLEELAGKNNKQGEPLIILVSEPKQAEKPAAKKVRKKTAE